MGLESYIDQTGKEGRFHLLKDSNEPRGILHQLNSFMVTIYWIFF